MAEEKPKLINEPRHGLSEGTRSMLEGLGIPFMKEGGDNGTTTVPVTPKIETTETPKVEIPKETPKVEAANTEALSKTGIETPNIAETPKITETPKVETPGVETLTITAEQKKRYDELEKVAEYVELVKRDTAGFLNRVTKQLDAMAPKPKPLEETLLDIRKKFPDDFIYSSEEAINNPVSDSAKYEIERQKAIAAHAQAETARELAKAEAINRDKNAQEVGKEIIRQAITEENKRYGLSEKDIEPFKTLVSATDDNVAKMIAAWYRDWAKANFSLTTTAGKLRLEESEAEEARRKAEAANVGASLAKVTQAKTAPPSTLEQVIERMRQGR